MDQTQTQQNIALYYSKLPKDLQEVFSSMVWLETLKNISSKYNLNQEQQSTLGVETSTVLLAIDNIDDYQNNLKINLQLPIEISEKIIQEINISILGPILSSLKGAYNNNVNRKDEEIIEEAVNKVNYRSTIYTIARSYNLNVTQMGALENAVTDLINGKINPDDFEDILEKNTELPSDEVFKIATEVNDKILSKIRESLKSLSVKEEGLEKIDTSDIGIPVNTPNHNQNTVIDLDIHKDIELPTLKQQEIKTRKEVSPTIKNQIQEEKLELKGEVQKEIPNIPKITLSPLLMQKLNGNFKKEMTTTDHSLNNLTKINPTNQTPRPPISYPPQKDPYRMNPEE